jgi:Acetyl-CoA hydrolase/transferase C-terminal domain
MSVVASQLRATLSKAQARRTFVAAEEERHEEAPLNGHQFTAAGGQLDFVRGAYASRGGKSVIAFASTTRGATISKIVPRLSGPVITPRNEVHYVATEYGIENLKGLSSPTVPSRWSGWRTRTIGDGSPRPPKPCMSFEKD